MKSKSKLVKLSISSVMIFSFILTGCGSNTSSPSQTGDGSNASKTETPKEKVELTWVAGAAYKEYFDNSVIKPFEDAHPNIKIKVTYSNEPETIIKQQLLAGAGPDIMTTDGTTTLGQFAKAGYLLPLDDYAQKYGWDKRFSDWSYIPVTINGNLYGLPGKYETELVFYNKTMFADNGWSIPKSYDELVELCEQIQAKGIIPFAFGNSDYKYANEWWYSLAFNSTLGPEDMEKLLKGEMSWSSPGPVEAIEKLDNLFKKGYISDKKSAAITNDGATQLLITGKAAMKMEGTWLIGNMLDMKPDIDWGMFAMPSWKEGVEQSIPLALGIGITINAKSKHQDEAAEFLDFWSKPETAIKGIPAKGMGFPPVKELDENEITKLDPHFSEAYAIMNDFTSRNATGYLSWTYWGPQTRVYTSENIDSVFYGQLDLKTFMDNMEEKAKEDKDSGKLFSFTQ